MYLLQCCYLLMPPVCEKLALSTGLVYTTWRMCKELCYTIVFVMAPRVCTFHRFTTSVELADRSILACSVLAAYSAGPRKLHAFPHPSFEHTLLIGLYVNGFSVLVQVSYCSRFFNEATFPIYKV